MNRRKLIGIILLIGPFALLFFTLIAYAVLSFVISAVVSSGSTSSGLGTVGYVVNTLLGLAGIVAIVGIIPGPIIGIYLILKSEEEGEKTAVKNLK